MNRLVLLLALVACKHSATGVPACDDALATHRACARALGGVLGDEVGAQADRLEAAWRAQQARGIKNWKEKWAPKWCAASVDDLHLRFPECP